LRDGQAQSFRLLQASAGDMSPSVLNDRLKELREARLVELGEPGYALTPAGLALAKLLKPLNRWAESLGRRGRPAVFRLISAIPWLEKGYREPHCTPTPNVSGPPEEKVPCPIFPPRQRRRAARAAAAQEPAAHDAAAGPLAERRPSWPSSTPRTPSWPSSTCGPGRHAEHAPPR
jgi:hypothetical protein